jgi:DNA repair protein RadC
MLEQCKFIDGRCSACGFACDLKNVHVPCSASVAIKNALLANAKKIAESPKKPAKQMSRQKGLGDLVTMALSAVGITKERVSKAIGRPCGCAKRQERLNELGRKIGIG